MRKITRALVLMLVLALTLALFACGGDKCTSHVDADKDAKCDNCGAAVACTECVDADGDGKCDVCGKDVETACTSHVDSNKDAKCDNCGAAVACAECVDDDGDEECDVCGSAVEPAVVELPLLIDGEPNFQFVLASGTNIDVRRTVEQTVIRTIKTKTGVELTSVTEGASNDEEMEIEVLIGNVSSRGERYLYDEHTLGKKGYVIKIVGKKIIINGGSVDAFVEAINEFSEDFLGFDGRNIDENAIMSSKDSIEEIQDDYKVTSLAVNGTDMKGYVIAADSTVEYYSSAALNLQDTLYTRTGYWLEIVPLENAPSKAVVMRSIPKVSGSDSFKIYADGETLFIDCAFDNMLANASSSFLTQKITLGKDDVNFEGTVYNQDISIVKYEDFGAKGDGRTDDFKAIFLAHDFANECGQTVVATPGKTYYIHSTDIKLDGEITSAARSAIIKTPVIWTGADFIIDDYDLSCLPDSENRNQCTVNIFRIVPDDDLAMFSIKDREVLDAITAAGIKPGTTSIKIPSEALQGWEGDVMIIPYNSKHKIYRRKNYGSFAGANMHEVIVLDKDGNVSAETPIAFDYTNIDYIDVYRLDESTAITVEGGNFITRATNVNTVYETTDNLGNPKMTTYGTYLSRGIYINRSFTTLKNVKHSVIDEVSLDDQTDSNGKIIKCVACYSGFYSAAKANHITLDGCQMYGRRCFARPEGGTGGTYGLSGNEVNKIVFKDCVQKNFWVVVENGKCIPAERDTPNAVPSMASYDSHGKTVKMHWGVGGTNFCKNMEYIGSTLSRFDAHEGLYHGKIIDSTVNYMAITGKGNFIVDNVEWYAEGTGYGQNSIIHLREDYGSTWGGPISIKDLRAYVYTNGETQIFYHSYTNWYRGYQVEFPEISLENVDYYNIKTFQPVDPGFEVYLVGHNQSIKASSKLHLETSHSPVWLSMEDKDPDGICDRCGHSMEIYRNRCTACKDMNSDGLCDVCGFCYQFVNVVPEGEENDNLCDVCGFCKTCVDNGDGYIDIPNDFDGDGVYGNSPFKYDDIYPTLADPTKGYLWDGNYENYNIVIPPEYVKIFGNDGVDTDGDGEGDGGYVFKVINTAANGISSGSFNGVEDNNGGFFGSTKFYYDDNDKSKYFQGTNHEEQTDTETFKFYH